jgi:hypothetical protein
VDLLGIKTALAKLSSDAQRRIQKLRCGWLPVNRRVSREDPDRLNGCTARSPSKMVEEAVDHIFPMPVPYCHARPACRYVQDVPVVKNLDDIDQSSSLWRYGVD